LIFFGCSFFPHTSQYFFPLNTPALTYQKYGIPQKNLDFVYSIPLFCCRFFFLNKTEIIDVLGVIFFLNKAIEVWGKNEHPKKINIQ
jgi:hypothetical protein